jgi:predicted Zn-dependent peptidase
VGGGVRVISERVPSVRSVALGIWIAGGSGQETPAQAGISHLLEHMLFRGTSAYSSEEIDQLFDEMGSGLNAETDKEATSLTSRVLDTHLARAFEAMSEMVWAPALSELEAEREVVLQEIAAYEDDPQDQVFDRFAEALFGDAPLGRPVIGTADVVAGIDDAQLRAFHSERYVPANVVVAAAGSIDHDELVAMAAQFSPAVASTAAAVGWADGAPATSAGQVQFQRKDTEQYHVCLGVPGIARGDERRFALRVLEGVLGATPSSRLFQEVRERRGLAYAVFSFSHQYGAAGELGVYVGTRPENLAEALDVIAAELDRVRSQPISPQELNRSRECAKSGLVLALESSGARMGRLGSALLWDLPILSADEIIARLDAVTAQDCAALAADLLGAGGLSVAAIGPDEDAFAGAVAPVQALSAQAPARVPS